MSILFSCPPSLKDRLAGQEKKKKQVKYKQIKADTLSPSSYGTFSSWIFLQGIVNWASHCRRDLSGRFVYSLKIMLRISLVRMLQ